MKTKRFMGQHFLVSEKIRGMILETASKEIAGANSILEIGPGRGAITEGLSKLGKPLAVVEKDIKFVEKMKEKYPAIAVIEADAAEFDIGSLDPAMLPVSVVGNLPYYAATDIILNLLSAPSKITAAHFMVQHEVALKFSSDAGDEYYSKYSIWAKAFYKTKVDFKVAPRSFSPPPKVLSAVMTFKPLKEPLVEEKDSREFYRFCSRMFLHPRKKLVSSFEGEEKLKALKVITENGVKEDARPGAIPAEIFKQLFGIIPDLKD